MMTQCSQKEKTRKQNKQTNKKNILNLCSIGRHYSLVLCFLPTHFQFSLAVPEFIWLFLGAIHSVFFLCLVCNYDAVDDVLIFCFFAFYIKKNDLTSLSGSLNFILLFIHHLL